MTKREYTNNLYDQLSLVERIENLIINKNKDTALNEIEIIKKEINRKLFDREYIQNYNCKNKNKL